MKEFDIVFAYFIVRKHNYYAHVIKELSSQYRIGLLLSDEKVFYSNKGNRKSMNTDKLFRSFCIQMGAERIDVGEKVKGKLVLIPVDLSHLEDYLFNFKKNVSWDKLIGLFSLKGNIQGLDRIKDLGVKKFYVPAKYLLEKRVEYEGKLNEIEDLDIIEIGLPHTKYPIFNDSGFDIDYLVAYPSHTHFKFKKNEEKDKYTFVVSLYKLLKKIDTPDKVYLKRHSNSDNSQYFSSLSYGTVRGLRVASFIADICLKMSPFFRQKLYRIGIKLKNSIIDRKYPSLRKATQFHNFGIECFLPYVRKGLITGYSTSHFHALYNELPV